MSAAKPNYPDLAETTFQSLCDQHNITRNRATQDRSGWDYVVEFRRTLVPGLAHDQQVGTSTARVQVKSATGRLQAIRLKLSNALRFTREPDMCFVVLFHFGKVGEFTKIYARHFHSELMAIALKRARQADRDGIEQLNRITIPVSFSETDDHSHDLIAWMRGICDQSPEKYAEQKKILCDSLGFGMDAFQITHTVRIDSSQDYIDHVVGLLPNPPVERVLIVNRRFGIEARTPVFDGKPTYLAISATPRDAVLVITGANGHRAEFSGELRGFTLPGLPLENARAVFSSPVIQVVLRGNNDNDVNFKISHENQYSLNLLKEISQFFLASDSEFELSVLAEGVVPSIGTGVAQKHGDSRWFKWFSELVSGLSCACRQEDNPNLSVNDIAAAEAEVIAFCEFVGDGEVTFRFGFEPSEPPLPHIRNFLGYAIASVGDWEFWAITRRPCMRSEQDNGRYVWVFGDPIVIESGVVPRGTASLRDRIEERIRVLTPRIGRGTLVMNKGDFSFPGDRLELHINDMGELKEPSSEFRAGA
jgi:hypothetical protein